MTDNIYIIEYEVCEKWAYVAMFNTKVISTEDARRLIEEGCAESDSRIVVMTKAQYENLIK